MCRRRRRSILVCMHSLHIPTNWSSARDTNTDRRMGRQTETDENYLTCRLLSVLLSPTFKNFKGYFVKHKLIKLQNKLYLKPPPLSSSSFISRSSSKQNRLKPKLISIIIVLLRYFPIQQPSSILLGNQ